MNLRPAAMLSTIVMLIGLTGSGQAQTVVFHNSSDGVVRDRGIDGKLVLRPASTRPLRVPGAGGGVPTGTVPSCGAAALAWAGQPLPGGEQGTLVGWAFQQPATINNGGRIAFTSLVDGAARNQGIFTADAEGLHVVALGCGGRGGTGDSATCGDASPLGGHFTGFFTDSWAVPVINDHGDVLFVADVHGGSGPRGLFLYRAASQTIIKVAATNDPSPLGGTFAAIGPGSLNNEGNVAFVAITGAGSDADILLWKNGVTSKYVAVGDPAPGGGSFWALSTELSGYSDGSVVPSGPVPAINDNEQIAFRGYVNSGLADGGLFLSQNGVHHWQVKTGELVPGGDAYADFGAPLLNNAGEIAFYSDIAGDPGAAWVAGSPGHWRRALAWFDQVGGGKIWGLTLSRNPMNSLNNNGDLMLWASRLMPSENELQAIVLSRPSGETLVVAGQSEATPLGGNWGSMDWYPVLNDMNQMRVGAGTPGLSGKPDTHMRLSLCRSGTPAYASSPTPGQSLAFGAVAVGATSAALGIDVGNPDGQGSAPDSDLRITSATADNPAFLVTLVHSGPFAAGSAADGVADVEVRCAPSSAGTLSAQLHIATNDPAQPSGGFSYPLSCAGLDDGVFRDGFDGTAP